MAMKKSIGRSLVHIDVAANTSVRIHEDFFNSHSSSHYLSQIGTLQLAENRLSSGGFRVANPPARYRIAIRAARFGPEADVSSKREHIVRVGNCDWDKLGRSQGA